MALPLAALAPVAAAGVSGIAGLVGASMSNSAAKSAARMQYEHNKEFMKSRHQWEVGDLKKAGLNPILSAGGNPDMASVNQADVPDFGRAMSEGANSAMEALRLREELKNIRADTAMKTDQATAARASASFTSASARTQDAQADLLRAQQPGADTEAAIDRSQLGKVLRTLGRFNPFSSSAKNIADTIKK